MTELDIWLIIGVLVIATAATRSSFWLVGHHINIPKRVQDMLRYAPACALAAIIAPDVLMNDGHLQLALSNLKLIAASVAVIFYIVRRNMLQTIVVGMVVFTALRLLHVF
jgi:branched-subunit amino acid transport protein